MKRFSRYFSLWHLKSVFILIYVDFIRLWFVRRPLSNTVLVLKLDRLGDYILCRNYLRLLRTYRPFLGRKIFLCASLNLKELIEIYDADVFDGFLWVDSNRFINEADYRFGILRQIKQIGAEIALHPTYARELYIGDCLMLASGAPQRIGREAYDSVEAGVRHSRSILSELGATSYNRLAPEDPNVVFDFYRYRSFFEKALPGVPMPENTRLTPIPVPVPEISEPFAIIMPGANQLFREWPPGHFADVARFLHASYGLRIIILGSSADKPKAEIMQQAAPETPMDNFCGDLSLPQIVYLASQCAIGVTNESGGLHLLAALDKPAVAVANGNRFGWFYPYPPELSSSVSFVYSPTFVAEPLDWEQRKEAYRDDSQFHPIESIQPEAVIERLTAYLQGVPFYDPLSAPAAL